MNPLRRSSARRVGGIKVGREYGIKNKKKGTVERTRFAKAPRGE